MVTRSNTLSSDPRIYIYRTNTLCYGMINIFQKHMYYVYYICIFLVLIIYDATCTERYSPYLPIM